MNTNLLEIIDSDEIDYTPIRIGKSWETGEDVEWDFGGASHPALLMVGRSGVGKTHGLKKLARALSDRGLAVHIIDSHGDIEVEGFDTFKFHYTSHYGINLFKVDPHPEFGGPQATISRVTSLLASQHSALGTLQKAMLGHACQKLYESKGIHLKKPETWHKEAFTIEELIKYFEEQILSEKTSIDTSVIGKLITLSSKMRKINKKLEHGVLTADEEAKLMAEKKMCEKDWTMHLQEATPDDFEEHLEKIRSGFSITGMQSLLILIRNLYNSGVFNGEEPDPSGSAVRYLIRGMELKEQVMLVETILERIFGYYARNITELNQPPHTFILIDEIKVFSQGAFKNPLHILNRLQAEARKLGIGLILAGQGVDHLPTDMLANMGTTVLLPIHDMATNAVVRKLNVHKASLDALSPRKDGMISSDGSEFTPCVLWT